MPGTSFSLWGCKSLLLYQSFLLPSSVGHLLNVTMCVEVNWTGWPQLVKLECSLGKWRGKGEEGKMEGKTAGQCQITREGGRPWQEPHPLVFTVNTSIYPSGAHLASEIIIIIMILIIMNNNNNTHNRGCTGGPRSYHMHQLWHRSCVLFLICFDVVCYAGNRTQGFACSRLVFTTEPHPQTRTLSIIFIIGHIDETFKNVYYHL